MPYQFLPSNGTEGINFFESTEMILYLSVFYCPIFSQVASPCISCVNDCDYLFCDKTCDATSASEIKFKLDNLTLSSSSDVTSEGGSVSAPSRYFLTVKASTGMLG